MKRLLAFLALCLPIYLFAQGFGSFSHDQPFFAKDTPAAAANNDPTAIPGLEFRWVASDLADGLVNTWTDRIQGWTFTKYNDAYRPTKSNNYVLFSGSQVLTNAAIAIGGQTDPVRSVVLFYKRTGTVIGELWGEGGAADGFVLNTYNIPGVFNYFGGGFFLENANTLNAVSTTVISHSNSVPTATFVVYTNGSYAMSYSPNPQRFFKLLGASAFIANGLGARLYELCVYTNFLVQTNVTLLSTYSSNTYTN